METQSTSVKNPNRTIAIVAGASYLMIFLTGIFANFFVIEPLFQPDDVMTSLLNVSEQISLFRLGILSFIVMVILDVLLVWALYILFKPVQVHLSFLAGLFRLVNAGLFAVALFHLLNITTLVTSSAYAQVYSAEHLAAEVMRSYQAFNHTWLVGLVFFGIHLIILGYLLIQSRQVPTWIGIALVIAAMGYLTDSVAQFLLPSYAEYQDLFTTLVVIPGVVGELSLTVWLLWRGGRRDLAFSGKHVRIKEIMG